MAAIRPPAAAGVIYPAEHAVLMQTVDRLLAEQPGEACAPRALIVPHGSYALSGTVAARAFVQLRAARERIHRVVLLGPSHQIPFHGIALCSVSAFETPLGRVPVDRAAQARLAELPQVTRREDVHRDEISLEAQLPFLQRVLDDFRVVPLTVGQSSAAEVEEVLDVLEGPDTLVVVSSDLSHYHSAPAALAQDRCTSEHIEGLSRIGYQDACARNCINALLAFARRRGLRPRTLALSHSGQGRGDSGQVIGYGAYAFY